MRRHLERRRRLEADVAFDDEGVDEPEVAVYCRGCWDREFVRGDGVAHS